METNTVNYKLLRLNSFYCSRYFVFGVIMASLTRYEAIPAAHECRSPDECDTAIQMLEKLLRSGESSGAIHRRLAQLRRRKRLLLGSVSLPVIPLMEEMDF